MDSNETIEERIAKLEQAARNLPTFGKPLPPLKPAFRRVVSEKKNGGRWTLGDKAESGKQKAEMARSSCPVDTEPMPEKVESGNEKAETHHANHFQIPTEHGEGMRSVVLDFSQADFEASGASAKQDAILIEFFSNPKTDGIPVAMDYLCELCGGHHMNNRAISLRRHFKPLGFGFWNEMRSFGPTGALHSHYTKLPIAECERRERERDELRERKKLERDGQRTLATD